MLMHSIATDNRETPQPIQLGASAVVSQVDSAIEHEGETVPRAAHLDLDTSVAEVQIEENASNVLSAGQQAVSDRDTYGATAEQAVTANQSEQRYCPGFQIEEYASNVPSAGQQAVFDWNTHGVTAEQAVTMDQWDPCHDESAGYGALGAALGIHENIIPDGHDGWCLDWLTSPGGNFAPRFSNGQSTENRITSTSCATLAPEATCQPTATSDLPAALPCADLEYANLTQNGSPEAIEAPMTELRAEPRTPARHAADQALETQLFEFLSEDAFVDFGQSAPLDDDQNVTESPLTNESSTGPLDSMSISTSLSTETVSSRPKDDSPVRAIQRSYTHFGLDPDMLIFSHVSMPMNPLALYLGSTAKIKSMLTERSMAQLLQRRNELLSYLPAYGSAFAQKRDIELVRRLHRICHHQMQPHNLVDIIKALRSRSDVTGDELHLLGFLSYSVLIVTKNHDVTQYAEAIEFLRNRAYKSELLSLYRSLHFFLLHLGDAAKNLHLLILTCLLRAGVRRLQRYFAHSTRSAALQLLLKPFNETSELRDQLRRMRELYTPVLAGEQHVGILLTPLERMHLLLRDIVEPSVVDDALGYDCGYLDRARDCRHGIPASCVVHDDSNRTTAVQNTSEGSRSRAAHY
ncbi:hypothetical protein KC338_g7934 [Hortaea werneckii]|nr:hypothetical protein KC338_g7934 [Hortaea werneckii]